MLKFISLCVFVSFCAACSSSGNKVVQIGFSSDSTELVLSSLEGETLVKLREGLGKDSAYQNVVEVLETPGEDDSLTVERIWPGRLQMVGDELRFKPDTPFRKGKSYLVETILQAKFGEMQKILKSDLGMRVQKQQKILIR